MKFLMSSRDTWQIVLMLRGLEVMSVGMRGAPTAYVPSFDMTCHCQSTSLFQGAGDELGSAYTPIRNMVGIVQLAPRWYEMWLQGSNVSHQLSDQKHAQVISMIASAFRGIHADSFARPSNGSQVWGGW